MSARSVVRIEVVSGNVLEHEADVLVLKFAQSLHGVDRAIVERLERAGRDVTNSLPSIGKSLLVDSRGTVKAGQLLFVGVQPLGRFEYAEIRQFARDAMRELAHVQSAVRYVALTIHGRGYGLDESEAFKAEVAGLLDAFESEAYPPQLELVTIVERDLQAAERLKALLDDVLPARATIPGRTRRATDEAQAARAALHDVGQGSKAKPHVFVAMPFAPELDDRFHYGIKGAVNAAGFLCERADLSAFTGDVLAWVRERIDKASLVVADLSSANPNVYLEVGYAWGRGVRTVLVAPSASDLRFDVRGQRCLIFNNIRHLEELLTRELVKLTR